MMISKPGNLPYLGTGEYPDHEDLVVPYAQSHRGWQAEFLVV